MYLISSVKELSFESDLLFCVNLRMIKHGLSSTFFAKKVEPKRVAREKFLRFYPPSKAGKRKLHRNSAECAVSNMRFPLTLDGGESRRNFSMRQLFIIV